MLLDLTIVVFTAEDRSDVDKMYELLKRIGATVLDAPAEHPYSPGYFAVYEILWNTASHSHPTRCVENGERAEELGFTHAWFYDSQLLLPDIVVSKALGRNTLRRLSLGPA